MAPIRCERTRPHLIYELTTAASLALLILPACSSQTIARNGGTGGSGSGGNVADAPPSDRPNDTLLADGSGGTTDVGADAPTDAAGDGPCDVPPGSDAAVCPTESDNGALKPSGPACTVAPLAINASSLCAGAAGCPVGALYSLSCAGSGYGPWVVPAGQGGSVMFVTNTGGFVTRLFTMVPGVPPEVNDVPGLTSAENALAADSDGNPTIFGGEMPGAWRVRKTPQGWRREHAVEVGSGLAMVTDGIAIDGSKSFIAYFNLDDQAPRLATRDGSCWRSTLLSGTRTASLGLDVDGLNRPWTAWFTAANNTLAVDLVGPDGNHRVWTSAVTTGGLVPNSHPVVMARGVTAAAGYPTLAMQRPDGVHVLVPGGTLTPAPTWTDRVVPASAMTTSINDCPPQAPPATDCAGRTSCQSTIKGVVGGFGAARTAAGRTYAAWLSSDGGSTYALAPANNPGMFCMGVDPPPDAGITTRIPAPPRLCGCQATVTTSHGTGTIVIGRVDTATPTEALRISFDTGAELRGGTLALAARGNTLLIVASLGIGNDTQLRYVEVDTTSLP